jgi:hypothetical protein
MKTNFLSLFLLLALIISACAIAKAPVPSCTAKTLYKQFPLTVGEILTHDMDRSFSGYNLNITLATNNSFASLTRKWDTLDRRGGYYPGIISHYIEPKDNGVGRDSFLLYKQGKAVMLTYGVIRNKDLLPEINSTAIITTEDNVVCFDAALFLEHGLAYVDCAKTSGTVFSTYSNVFYIVDLTDHSIKQLPNDMYISFSKITKRTLQRFSHPLAGGYEYMTRTYYYDAVD